MDNIISERDINILFSKIHRMTWQIFQTMISFATQLTVIGCFNQHQ